MTYQPTPLKTEGGQRKAWTSDDDVEHLLREILAELKALNLQLSLMNDQTIDPIT
ncbi:hypothetical protein LCGC14_3104010 [marine sediment metagenome]|uniref:Uncharacterized protein n=1 Tax=marine sediment metagenome TaxID=412755 RepID=A0A0F8WVU6_9ZZZZ